MGKLNVGELEQAALKYLNQQLAALFRCDQAVFAVYRLTHDPATHGGAPCSPIG